MTYEQLITLRAIINEGTFRGAAQRLNKSQSAISHMLKKLEEEIGVTLLSRADYRPKLTPEGAVFYRHATRALDEMQQLGSLAKTLSAAQEAEVSLAVTATYPLRPLLGVIEAVTRAYPATHIRLARESMGGPIERLLEEAADIIIATMDGVPGDQVTALPFAEVRIIPVARPDFEPAQTPDLKSIATMKSHVQVVVADSSSSHAQSRDVLPGGLRWTVSDFAAKKEILLAGMGWGGLPEHLIVDELARGDLVALNIEGFPPRQSQLFQMRHRDRTVGRVAGDIWDRLTQVTAR